MWVAEAVETKAMQGLGAMSVVTARAVLHALEDRGVDPDRVLAAARLSRDALRSPEHRLPHSNVRALWEAAAAAVGDVAFGVHVAETLPRGSYELVEYLLGTASTLGEGLTRVCEHSRLIYDHCNLRLIVEPRGARIVANIPVAAPQYDEFWIALLVVRTRQLSGVAWNPDRVTFQHDRRDDVEITRLMGCPVTFRAPQTEVRFRRSVLQLPIATADPMLSAILVRYAMLLRESLPPHGSLVARASAVIQQRMTRELPSLAAIARALDLPRRTLQRQLSSVGATHTQLVDEARRELALARIGDAGIAITEIAYVLHFADPSAFYRAFKRWTGQSPRRYRERLYEAGARIGK